MSMKAERTEAKKAPMGNETGKTRMNGIYVLVQCTWGALQTLLGLAVFALHVKERHSCNRYFFDSLGISSAACPQEAGEGNLLLRFFYGTVGEPAGRVGDEGTLHGAACDRLKTVLAL